MNLEQIGALYAIRTILLIFFVFFLEASQRLNILFLKLPTRELSLKSGSRLLYSNINVKRDISKRVA